jgi:hypothetical protein
VKWSRKIFRACIQIEGHSKAGGAIEVLCGCCTVLASAASISQDVAKDSATVTPANADKLAIISGAAANVFANGANVFDGATAGGKEAGRAERGVATAAHVNSANGSAAVGSAGGEHGDVGIIGVAS